ncbi:hypothetical protein BDV96DRAFT_599254 [Lophiotrema nucula]|uniref:Uncharacterized protein n=1 Tax=Lophiotrema nucula TaxID=690887 RepID=A0A6A5Z834_9PLEO|nr:hypothetical protein BDV96DRAFT_599254 [Lophiotrema nucula]
MCGMPRSYTDYVKEQSNLDNSLQGLAEFIQDPNGQQQFPVNIACIDFAQRQTDAPRLWRVDPGDGHDTIPESVHWTPHSPNFPSDQRSHEYTRKKKLTEMTTIPDDIQGRIILVEDIDRHSIAYLGTQYNIPLSFFATYLTTDLSQSEHEPQPPSIVLAPSQMIGDQFMHLHYQRVVELGTMKQRKNLYLRSNVRRLVKPTPLLNKRCPGLARSCCSLYLCNDDKDKWICIILVDATNAELAILDTGEIPSREYPQSISRHTFIISDFWAWEGAQKLYPSEKEPCSSLDADLQSSNSLLHSLIRLFHDVSSVAQPKRRPDLLTFAYFPAQLIIAEWMQYALLLSRYVKHYEYTLISPNVGLKQSKVKELLPWRRRCIRSGHKLELLRRSLKHHILTAGTSEVQRRWRPILDDIDHVSSQMAEWATFLNAMVPLLDSHQSLIEAQSVRHLTYIVLVFSSMGLVASIFSMSERVLPWGGGQIWLYFAVALPLTAVVLGLYISFLTVLRRLLIV